MGLFGRKKKEASEDASSQEKSFGHAAFDPGDVEDARRGHPAVSLEPFAQAKGLEEPATKRHGRFVATLPLWPDYIFNPIWGPMPSGRLGLLAHELLEFEAHEGSIEAGGTFYDVRVTTRAALRESVGLSGKDLPNEPFVGNAVWIPTTTVHVRVPETVRLPGLRISNARGASMSRGSDLDRYGLPGFRVRRGGEHEELLQRAVPAIAPLLGSRDDPYVYLRVEYGVVALTVNGYRSDPGDLERLIATADDIACALGALVEPVATPGWDQLGPAFGSLPANRDLPLPHPAVVPQYAAFAKERGFHHEERSHLEAILPQCPVPGIASGVLAGRLEGVGPLVRLAWFEGGVGMEGALRGSIMVPARPGATTPLTGLVYRDRGLCVDVSDGVACCWRGARQAGQLAVDDLLRDGLSALEDSGVAAL